MPDNLLPKLIVLCGPTASGKTQWGIDLAKRFNGEVISADSRQVYKKMTIGTAKPRGEWRWNGLRRSFFVDDVPHHLLDFLDPGKVFSVAEFRDRALKYTKLAYQQGRVPMIVGGTGLYISSLVDNFVIPRVSANQKLRRSLEEKPLAELVVLLEKLDPEAARTIDVQNPRRVIRALEVCILTGDPFSHQRKKGEPMFEVLQIGIKVSREVLSQRISDRVDQMLADGLVDEVKKLLKQKYGWHLPSMNGIGYRQLKDHLEDKCDVAMAAERLKRDTRQLARRQMTWFRRDSRIVWCENFAEAEDAVANFLGRDILV